jgi:hypothetical protein
VLAARQVGLTGSISHNSSVCPHLDPTHLTCPLQSDAGLVIAKMDATGGQGSS